MARRVIGYAKGRPLYEDEGPARAHGVTTGLASIAGPKMPDRLLVGAMFASGGAGEVERRQITADERAARHSRDAAPSLLHRASGIPSPARPHNTAAESRARGAARAGFTPGATKPYLTSPASRETGGSESAERAVIRAPGTTPAVQARRSPSRELPGVIAGARRTQPITAVTPSPLEEGSMVASIPAVAPPASNGHVNIPASISGNYSRPRAVDVVTPCDDCSHAPICRIRPMFQGLAVDATFADVKLDPAIRIVAVSVECEYFLERDAASRETPAEVARRLSPVDRLEDAREGVTTAPAPDDAATRPSAAARPSAPAAKPTGLSARQEKVLAVVVRHRGNRQTAANELGVVYQSVDGVLETIARKGVLPADVIALMPKRIAAIARAAS